MSSERERKVAEDFNRRTRETAHKPPEFAYKNTLEGTQYSQLRELVEAAMRRALDAFGVERETLANYEQLLAIQFCGEQDKIKEKP